jgi:hypothetical protein
MILQDSEFQGAGEVLGVSNTSKVEVEGILSMDTIPGSE